LKRGKCKLCLLEKDLQESHLMPRALYRKARGSGQKGNQDPHLLRASGRRPSSYQVTDYVFCRECEQRFSKNGEEYVMGLVTRQDLRFPFLEMLDAIPTITKTEKWRMYSAAQTPNIDRAKIAYFALSLFWRASVHTWQMDDGEKVRIELGSKYNEEIRRYLLGEASIPHNAALLVTACTDRESQISFFMPGENKKVKDRSFGVGVRGLFFLFRITNSQPPWHARLSMINTPEEWISAYNCFDQGIWRLDVGK
jgi:hypothetical protein